jgi:cell division protein FtsB
MRLATPLLIGLVGLAQLSLWFGKASLPAPMALEQQLVEQRAVNERARLRNARISAEVGDLREGLEMVEETARRELGMVKPDEVLVQYTSRR